MAMHLLNLPIRRTRKLSTNRRGKAFRPSLSPDMERLEDLTVLTGGPALVAPLVAHSPITITGINVANLVVTGAKTLTADLNVSGTLNTSTSSTPFTLHNVQLPITASAASPAAPAAVPILNLSLQIPDLNLLGLHVRLDNCNNGPVTVAITAQPGGGLLGDLLSDVDGLLNGGGGLLNLGGATGSLTGTLTTILDGLLTDLTTGSTAGTGGTMGSGTGVTDTIPAGDTELVNLHLGPITADVLGLDIATSQICLNVYADPNGGLLGSLLSSLDNLLNNGGNNGNAQNVLVRNILNDISRLHL
jgi:hypothetical protein